MLEMKVQEIKKCKTYAKIFQK